MTIARPRIDITDTATEAVAVKDGTLRDSSLTPPDYYQELLRRPDVRELLARLASGNPPKGSGA